MIDRNIVILFGAGASYGAVRVLPEPPPLGKCLYNALSSKYPTVWGSESALGKWAEGFREDFERTMLQDVLPWVSSLSLLEWHRPVAIFFAGCRLDGTGLDMYSQLLTSLKTKGVLERVTFSSLNYDCLLEQAMLYLGLTADYMLDDYSPEGSIPLAKIHGSCNFITPDLSSHRALMTNANGSAIDCSVTPLPLHDLKDSLRDRFSKSDSGFYPVLGLYSREKPSLVAPGRLQKLRMILTERINGATAIILIGVKPNPQQDSHLWKPIAQSYATKIAYVGSKGDYDTLKKLQARTVHVAETFAASVPAIVSTLSA